MLTFTYRSSLSIIAISMLSLVRCEQDEETTSKSSVNRLVVISGADNIDQESFVRFNRSIEAYNLRLELLRTDGSQIDSYSNGLKTVDSKEKNKKQFELLRSAVEAHKGEHDLVLMLIGNSNSTIINGNEQAILSRFEEFHRSNGTRILFSADKNCWPNTSLADEYPHPPSEVKTQQKFLNSRALIGFASNLWELLELVSDQQLVDKANYDFQLYSTLVYLVPEHRKRLKIELDLRSSLFENLDGKISDDPPDKRRRTSYSPSVELEFVSSADEVVLKNLIYNTRPLVVHGSGSYAKIELNSLGNYLGRAWTPRQGCRRCNESMISLSSIKNSNLPSVLIGVFIEEPTPFMDNFFDTLKNLNYPKERIHLFVHNAIEYHEKHLERFMSAFGAHYASQQVIDFKQQQQVKGEWQAREYALRRCQEVSCEYYLSLDSVARLEWPESLRTLIETNRTIVAPLLSRPDKLWSNCWGAITRDGYYARSHDYVELVAGDRTGVWNVPLVMNAYLIEGKFLRHQMDHTRHEQGGTFLSYHDEKFTSVKPVLIFARNLRQANLFQYVTNMHDFGHLIDPTDYNTTHLYPDLYQLEQNKHDWEREYLHENYTDLFDERDEDEKNYPDRIRLEEPCRDVYWFPLVSEKFCDQLVEMMEHFGQWSSGTTSDPRIEGGYESVPTRDIHFKQVGLHNLWLYFLREYVMPIQLKEYIGYEHDPPRTDLAFVVRYNPSEQPSLRPHHDSSTYTLNIALNTPGKDYEGGGCRFVRYNCSVTESRRGWALIHPGRLTHYHEGLPVTKGTRYILVTFIDP